MAHQHQAKRPYGGSQSQITNYFSRSTSSTAQTYSKCESTASPPLPAVIQSNLLSVGMRVRKSVPEGYKTGSYSAFTLFADSSPPSSFSSTSNMPQERKIGRRRARELTPFCGILKVGGMGVQDMPDGEDGVPSLSQGSTDSEVSVQSSGNKRRFEEEEEEEGGSGGVVFGLGNGWGGDRVFAVPRRRKEKVDVRMGQENINMMEGGDFEDAEFLDYRLIEEVEMGGV